MIISAAMCNDPARCRDTALLAAGGILAAAMSSARRGRYFFTNFLTSPRKSAPYTLPSKSVVTPSARLEPPAYG